MTTATYAHINTFTGRWEGLEWALCPFLPDVNQVASTC